MEEQNLTQKEREELHKRQIEDKIKSEKNKKLIKKITIYSIMVIIVILITYLAVANAKKPGKYDDFAQCLTKEGAVEYGAFWCPNCAKQKEMFGKSFKYITYVECDARGKDAQPLLCQENNIKGYPTWNINGTKYEGVQSLERLSSLTGCVLQQE